MRQVILGLSYDLALSLAILFIITILFATGQGH